jgi:5-formyltetrahydrofolate cyclo-ligase
MEDITSSSNVGPSADLMPKSHNEMRRQKRDLRRAMQTHRDVLEGKDPYAALAVRDRFLRNIVLPPNSVISSYVAIGSEINPAPLIAALRGQGHRIALPVVTGRGVPLIFRLHQSGDALSAGVMSLMEPPADAPLIEPDILLVPLLAFDHDKFRVGYGGGYYDRTLTFLRAHKKIMAVGMGYAGQEVPNVPIGSHDEPLDKIITENQVIH